MNNITNLLDLEDPDIIISETSFQGQVKTITLETKPVAHFCPSCGFRMYSRGVKERTINHPVLQDGYSLINRKVKDLKRLGRGFSNFDHFRNRFLYATRSAPVLNGITDSSQVVYFEEDDF